MAMKAKIDGLAELQKQLRELADPKTAKKALRRAATAAIRPMRKAVKSDCPVDSGGLKKSIDSKVSLKNGHVSAIVGSDTAVMEDGKKGDKSASAVRAARILHLVLFGHITDDGKAVAGNNFMQRGFENSQATCLQIYADKMKESIEEAASAK